MHDLTNESVMVLGGGPTGLGVARRLAGIGERMRDFRPLGCRGGQTVQDGRTAYDGTAHLLGVTARPTPPVMSPVIVWWSMVASVRGRCLYEP